MQILTSDELKTAVHRAGQNLGWQCSRCAKTFELGTHDGCGTGYGRDGAGDVLCYQCCGELDLARMTETGRAVLYLKTTPDFQGATYGDAKLTNWPGTVTLQGRFRRGAHNIARYRYDVWFKGPDGVDWHGVQYGDNTQICHCKRMKGKA